MKLEKKQRFSIRKYSVGAASVLIGFAFSAQVVSGDGLLQLQQLKKLFKLFRRVLKQSKKL